MKNILFPCILLLIWSNTAFSQCEKYIFTLTEKSSYISETVLEDLCAANTGLEWEMIDSTKKNRYIETYEFYREGIQVYTHFSNVFENAAGRQLASVSLKDEKTGKAFFSDIVYLAFYYQYQADSLISTIKKYDINSYGTPFEYGGRLLVLKSGNNILIFFGDFDTEEKELEKIYLVCKKALEEG
jgi:hypothetical protein